MKRLRNLKRLSKYMRMIKRIIDYVAGFVGDFVTDYLNSFSREILVSLPRVLWGLLILLASLVLTAVSLIHVLLILYGEADPAHFGLWYLTTCFSGGVGLTYTYIGIIRRSDSLRMQIRGKVVAVFLVHMAYLFSMLASLGQFDPNFFPSNRVPTMPYVCLLLLALVETTACFLYFHDIFRGLERGRPSRWWIRTTPYPVIGFIFLLFVNLWNDYRGRGADFSLVFSVAVSVLAVNYLVQIINERIVPKEGPYKKTYTAVYNRPAYNGPVHRPFSWKAHAQGPKPSSPSAGRGEGAC